MLISAASTTGMVGAQTTARPQTERTTAPAISRARFPRMLSIQAPTAGWSMMPVRPLTVRTAPIVDWVQCALVRR